MPSKTRERITDSDHMPRGKLAQEIYAVLSRRIRNFQLSPAERLTEVRLSEEFGVSRTPVREALRLLTESGLVVAVRSSRGYMVRQLDIAAVEQIYEVRRVLETLVVELASTQSRTPQFGQFMDEVRAASERANSVDAADMREEFHERLAAFTRNELLIKFLREVDNRIYWTRRLDHYAPDQFRRKAQKEHYQILQHMAASRVGEAKELMSAHIAASGATIKALVLPGRPILVVPQSDSGGEPGRLRTKR